MAGALEHEVVSETLSQVKPATHLSPQPPQLLTSEEISTHAPAQQRELAEVPHFVPSAFFVETQ
jgi:hypothetical protein